LWEVCLFPIAPAECRAQKASETGVILTPMLTPGLYPYAITTGPDGNLWFTENSDPDPDVNDRRIGRMTVWGSYILSRPRPRERLPPRGNH
jgi:hypothetical protein